MAKHTKRLAPAATLPANPSPAAASASQKPEPESAKPETSPGSSRRYFLVLLIWLGGFLLLTLILFAETIPLLWYLLGLSS